MICLITGVPGSGKSLALIKRYVIPALRKGRRIYTNIDGLNDSTPNPYILQLSFISGVPPEDVEKLIYEIPSKLYNKVISEMPAGSLAVVDEAQIFWNARDYLSESNKGILPYFQKHRHYGHDIILATQHFEQLDSGIRRLAEIHYRLKRLKNAGLNKVIKVSVFSQGITIDCKPVAHEAWSIDRGVFGCYKSYENGKISEVKYKSHNVFLRSPMMWVCFLFFCYFAYYVASGKLSRLASGQIFVDSAKSVSSSSAVLSTGIPARDSINAYFNGIYKNGELVSDYWCHRQLFVELLMPDGSMRVDSLPYRFVPNHICPEFGYLLSKKRISL